MSLLKQTDEIINCIVLKTDTVILFYSAGKDSIALLDLLSKKFKKVVCVFMHFVPNLEHIEKYITLSEKLYSNIEFIRLPHWNLTYIHRSGLFCAPNDKIKLLKLKDIIEIIRHRTGLEYVFLGMKQNDNLNRKIMLRGYELEAISETKLVYPLSKWKDREVLRYIQDNRLPSPIQYGNKRSNGVSFDIDVFLWLRNNYPNDLKKIIEAYPLSGKILFEYDQKNKPLTKNIPI